jgi:hypothetical protein
LSLHFMYFNFDPARPTVPATVEGENEGDRPLAVNLWPSHTARNYMTRTTATTPAATTAAAAATRGTSQTRGSYSPAISTKEGAEAETAATAAAAAATAAAQQHQQYLP